MTPTWGTAETIPLTDASGSWGDSVVGFEGTISYSYTETVEYNWVHEDDYEGPYDPPSSTEQQMDVGVTFDFIGNSGEAFAPGNGSASFTVNGNSVSAERITEPDGNWGSYLISDTSGTFTIPVEVTLTGESGSYTVTYSGTLDTGGNGVMGGIMEVQRSIPLGNGKYVNITSPKGNAHIEAGLANSVTVTFNGWFRKPPGYKNVTMRVRLEAFPSTNVVSGINLGTFTTGGPSGTWTFSPSVNTSSLNITIIARLQYQNANNEWIEPPGFENDCRHRISISVN